jgi:hypothetical protein
MHMTFFQNALLCKFPFYNVKCAYLFIYFL